jgi:iron(III) transport system substrate-binding protein
MPKLSVASLFLLAWAATPGVILAALQEDWGRVLQAAKKEGTVAIAATVGTGIGQALTKPFEEKYGIRVEYSGLLGGQLAARLKRERDAGLYLLDVVVHGTTTALTALKPTGALDPIEPALILPEVKDVKQWLGGKLWFSDKQRLNVLLGLTTRPAFAINSKLTSADQFKSFKDLLDPKWNGKIIVARDPRIAGPGQAIFTHFFMHRDLGTEFIRGMAKQKMTILRDDRQAMDWLGQGKYPIALGPPETISEDFIDKGVPIQLIPPQQLREGGDLSPGPASLMLINKAPHPNAARVYINWLMSKEGQTAFSATTGIPSLRLDVPSDHIVPWRRPVPGYLETYTEDALARKDDLLKLLDEVLPK